MNLSELILAERDRAYRLAQRVTGDADLAADVLQETCLSVLAAERSGGAAEPRTRSWFLKAVVNTARDMQKGGQRRRAREERWAMEREPAGAETPSQSNIRAELIREVASAMRELDAQYRLPLALCYEEGLTHAEAAEILGMERSSVGFHVQRALDRLRERLCERGIKAAPAVVIGGLGTFQHMTMPPAVAVAVDGILAKAGAAAGETAAGVSAGVGLSLGWKVLAGVAGLAALLVGALWLFTKSRRAEELAQPENLYDAVEVTIKDGAPVTKPGTKKWELAGVGSMPAISAEGAIYVVSITRRLQAVGPDGAVRWEFPKSGSLPSGTLSPVVGSNGTVFVACSSGLYAVSPDGAQNWLLQGQFAGGPPAIGADGTLYVVDGSRNLLAVDPADGSRKWAWPTTWGSFLAAVAPDGGIYTLTPESKLCALNPDGTQKWVSGVAGLRGAMVAFGADGTAYAAGPKLYAVNPDGTLKWEFSKSAQESFNGFPVVGADGTVYAASLEQATTSPFMPTIRLYALNPDGSQKWALANPGNAAIASDGTIYAAGTSLFAIGQDGAQKWVFGEPGSGDGWSPIIGQDGTVYLWSSTFTKLLAICGSAGPADSPWPMFGHDAQHTFRAGAGR